MRQPSFTATAACNYSCCRAHQILRFKKELAFLVTTGRHADTALWWVAAGLGWAGLGWAGLGWAELGWAGLVGTAGTALVA